MYRARCPVCMSILDYNNKCPNCNCTNYQLPETPLQQIIRKIRYNQDRYLEDYYDRQKIRRIGVTYNGINCL